MIIVKHLEINQISALNKTKIIDMAFKNEPT